MAEPIELHYWPTSNGHKITIALEEMGLPYVIRPVNINRGEQFDPAFLAISPNNRIPAILDPEGPGGKPISVFESGAILQYLGRKSGRFYGADERDRVAVDEWLFWQVGGLGPMAGQANHFRGKGPGKTVDQRHLAMAAIRYTDEVRRLWGVLDRRLEGRDYLCGDYSLADMACWPWTRNPGKYGMDPADFPNVQAWGRRMAERPAVKTALALEPGIRAAAAAAAA